MAPPSASATDDVYFFCRDGRILPSLGQQSFAMLEFEQPNTLRLYNGSNHVVEALGMGPLLMKYFDDVSIITHLFVGRATLFLQNKGRCQSA